MIRSARIALVSATLATLLLVGALALPRAACASDSDARARYQHAVQLYGQGQYAAALAEFEQVYALHRRPALLFNIGQTHYQLGHYASATRWLERYLAEPTDALSSDRRARVREQLVELATRTGRIALDVDVPGTELEIDGANVGTSPRTAPVLVDVGRHQVRVANPGYVTSVVPVEVRAGEVRSVAVRLVPLADPHSPTLETAAWISAGAFGVLAIASAVVTVLEHRRYEDALRSPQEEDPADAERSLRHQRSLVRGWALAADLFAAAGLGSGGLALYVHWQSAHSPSTEVTPLDLAVSGAGLSARMEF